jgi:hypothetical protein
MHLIGHRRQLPERRIGRLTGAIRGRSAKWLVAAGTVCSGLGRYVEPQRAGGDRQGR